MFCPQCGEKQPDEAEACEKCGHVFAKPSSEVEKQETATPGASQTTPEVDDKTPTNTVAAVGAVGKPKSKKPLIIGAVAVVAIVVVAVVAFVLSGALTKGQTAETFKTQLEQDSFVKSGVASKEYLNDSTYTLTSYSCSDIKVSKDPSLGIDMVTANIDATIDNDNYTTEAKLVGTYYDTKGTAVEKYLGSSSSYSFSVVSSTTTPKKGIDYDKTLKLENCESVLSDDKKSCTVKQAKTSSYWFGDASDNTEYTFTFDGSKWVEPKKTDPVHTVTYKNLDGNYAAKTGTLTGFSKFTVSNVDSAKGTFTIDYAYSKAKTLASNGGDISGTMTATMDPKESSWTYAMDDGYSYYFEAKGTSSGGNGQAGLKGYLINSNSGEDTIQVESMSLDYPSTYNFANSFTGYGPLFKQAAA